MSRSLPIDYYPDPVPNDQRELTRYLDEELHRISRAFTAQPVALSVEQTGTWPVTTAVTWAQLFVGQTPSWDVPGGNFDPVTGFWTCPQAGLYSVNLQLEVQPFGAGNKTYYAGLRLYRDRGGVIETRQSTDGGDDAIPLGVVLSGLTPFQQGDILRAEATIVHDQFVGSAPYVAGWQILRES